MQDIEKFITGFERFQQRYFGVDHELFDHLRQQQKPTTLVIACCDSRADPALLLGCDPGDIFMIRNVANLVPPRQECSQHHGVSAALQFAVNQLQVERIVILGHAGCGGIRALMQGLPPTEEVDFLGSWLTIAAPARENVQKTLAHKTAAEQLRACEQAAILLSLKNLLSFPWVQRGVEAASLKPARLVFRPATRGAAGLFRARRCLSAHGLPPARISLRNRNGMRFRPTIFPCPFETKPWPRC